MKYIYIIIVIVAILSSSCEKILDLPVEDMETQMVLNSIIYPSNNYILANLTKSKSIFDNSYSFEGIWDATIKLYEDDVFIGDMYCEYDPTKFNEDEWWGYPSGPYTGNYILYYKPKIGKKYRAEAFHNKYGNVSATTSILPEVLINRIDSVSAINEEGEKVIKLSINFTDPAEENNYYLVNFYSRQVFWDEDSMRYESMISTWFETNDPIVEEDYNSSQGILFSDELINGKDYSLNVNVSRDLYYSPYSDSTTLLVTLKNITEDMYKYNITKYKQIQNGGDPFSEPVRIFSNVSNGFGIMGACTNSLDSMLFVKERDIYHK